MEIGFKKSKAKYFIKMWEKLDQRLQIPWDKLNDIKWTCVRVVEPVIETRKDARKWLALARKHPRKELEELVRREKAKREPQEPSGRGKIEDRDADEAIARAAATDTPYVEDVEDPEVLEEDGSTLLRDEVTVEDPETGEPLPLNRLTFIVDGEQFSHIVAALERMAQVTGVEHPGELLDFMAAEVNETLADGAAGGAVHRLDWYVKNLERLFEVKIDVEIPKNSKLRKMSRLNKPKAGKKKKAKKRGKGKRR